MTMDIEEYIYLDNLDRMRHRPYHYTRKNLEIQAAMMARLRLGSPCFVLNQLESFSRGAGWCLLAFIKETSVYIGIY